MSKNRQERFWTYVDKTGEHWLWAGAKYNGYGVFRWNGNMEGAHRLSLMMSLGRLLRDGEEALHDCDIKLCVRPSCLFSGTQADNLRDMTAKGRRAMGKSLNHPPQDREKNHGVKYSEEQVDLVKRMNLVGFGQREISRLVGMHHANVWCIIHGKSWN